METVIQNKKVRLNTKYTMNTVVCLEKYYNNCGNYKKALGYFLFLLCFEKADSKEFVIDDFEEMSDYDLSTVLIDIIKENTKPPHLQKDKISYESVYKLLTNHQTIKNFPPFEQTIKSQIVNSAYFHQPNEPEISDKNPITQEEFKQRLKRYDYNFANTLFDFPIDLSDHIFYGSVDFSQCIFKENVSCKNTSFLGGTFFDNTQFCSSVHFSSCTFGNEHTLKTSFHDTGMGIIRARDCRGISFDNCTVENGLQFFCCEMKNRMSCMASTCMRIVFFSNVIFHDIIGFISSHFQEVNFKKVTVKMDAYFISTVFSQDIKIEDVQFGGFTRFSFAKFEANLLMRNTIFEKGASFQKAHFSKNFGFEYVIFKDWANFNCATFKEDINTLLQIECKDNLWLVTNKERSNHDKAGYYIKFNDDVDFSHSTCEGNLNFSYVHFRGEVNFESAKFHNTVLCNNASFHGIAKFESSNFLDKSNFSSCAYVMDANFSHANFLKSTLFTKSSFAKESLFQYTQFHGIADFSDSIFQSNCNFSSTYFFKDSLFIRSTFNNNTSFQYTSFNGIVGFDEMQAPKLDLLGSKHRGSLTFSTESSYPTSANRETARVFKHQLQLSGNNIEALHFYREEMELYRKELQKAKGGWSEKIQLWFLRVSSNYGLSWVRGVVFIVCWVLATLGLFILCNVKDVFALTKEYPLDSWVTLVIDGTLKVFNITNWNNIIEGVPITGWGHLALFIGRIFISLGIYQTIQALRKFSRTL